MEIGMFEDEPELKNDKVFQYLLAEKERRNRAMDPRNLAAQADREEARERNADNASLAEGISKAMSKIGSVGGKEAGSTLDGFGAQAQNQLRLADARDARSDARQDKLFGMDTKVAQYLADIRERRDTRDQNMSLRRDQMLASTQEKERDRDFRREMARLTAATKVDNKPASKREFDALPVENQKEIEDLSKKNAAKVSIANQMKGYLDQYDKAPSEQDKIVIGRQMLKVLNSPEGADAIGVEESRRLGGLLEYQMFNLTNPGPMFGRDLPGFRDQVAATVKSVEGGTSANRNRIDELYGRQSNREAPNPDLNPKAKNTSGKAFANPALSPADKKALDWASRPENKNDPRAIKIRELHEEK